MAKFEIAQMVQIWSPAGHCSPPRGDGLVLCGLPTDQCKSSRRLENSLHTVSVTEYSEVTLTTACRNEIIRSLTTDGNFTADHIKQKRDKDDVWLTNGEGMMTARARYHAHLAVAVETLDVCVHSKFIVLEINLVLSMIQRKVISGVRLDYCLE